MNFLVLEGTVRDGRKSIHAARYAVEEFEEKGHEAELFDPKDKDIPFLGNRSYKEDEQPTPEAAEEFSRKVEEADCLVIVTPEYNHSIPGSLKNLLDYLYPEYDDKPFAYITVSAGGFGGIRALDHLQDITLALGGIIGPSLQVSNVHGVFSNEGELVDKDYIQKYEDFVEEVVKHVEKNT